MAVIVVEQHAKLALSLTRQAIVLERGRVVHRSDSEALLRDPDDAAPAGRGRLSGDALRRRDRVRAHDDARAGFAHQALELRRVDDDLRRGGAQPIDRLGRQDEGRRQLIQVRLSKRNRFHAAL